MANQRNGLELLLGQAALMPGAAGGDARRRRLQLGRMDTGPLAVSSAGALHRTHASGQQGRAAGRSGADWKLLILDAAQNIYLSLSDALASGQTASSRLRAPSLLAVSCTACCKRIARRGWVSGRSLNAPLTNHVVTLKTRDPLTKALRSVKPNAFRHASARMKICFAKCCHARPVERWP